MKLLHHSYSTNGVRPSGLSLVWLNRRSLGERRYYYTHDGNKNVSEVIAADGSVATHYKYAPFGAIVTQNGTSVVENPWCYSSECVEDDTATIYYNYRHLELETGRWMSRDPITETEDRGLYVFVGNQVGHMLDSLGLAKLSLEYETSEEGKMTMSEISEDFRKKFAKYSQDGDEPYNCLSHLRLIGHGSEGSISLGKHTISQYWIDSYLKRKANGERPPKDEPTEALDMLSLAPSFACNDFTIEFVSCCSGRGDDGDYLKQSLRKLLGEKSNIILYEREVGKCFGFVIEKPYWLSWWESFGGGGKGQLKYARGKSK